MGHIFLAESIEIVSKEAFSILLFLLPGFIAAWVFYGLTAYPKKEPFERLVQAFIFTMFVKIMNIAARKLWWAWWHTSHLSGLWTDTKEIVSSVVCAFLLGLITATCANRDWVHGFLRLIKITYRNSHAPNTYNSFDGKKRYVVLTLKDGRRVKGWAKKFPEQYDQGYFLLTEILWLDSPDGGMAQPEIESTMIDVADIKMVQFQSFEVKGTLSTPTHEAIAARARSLWQEYDGRRDVQDWSQAENQLMEEERNSNLRKSLRGRLSVWLSNWASKLS